MVTALFRIIVMRVGRSFRSFLPLASSRTVVDTSVSDITLHTLHTFRYMYCFESKRGGRQRGGPVLFSLLSLETLIFKQLA